MIDTELLKSWLTIELREIAEIVTGNTPPKNDKSNYGTEVPFVKPPELLNSTIKQTNDFLSKDGAKVGRVLPASSVLVSCIGNLGKVGINEKPVAFNQQINAILPGKTFLSEFLFYQAQSPYFKSQLEELSSATTVAIVNKGKFESIKISLPPLAEQHRIVAKIEELFSELDNGVAQLRQVHAQLKSYRQSVLKHAFEGKLTGAYRSRQSQELPPAQALLSAIQQERADRHQQALKDWQRAVIRWVEAGKPGKKPPKPKASKELPPLTDEEVEKLSVLPEGWAWVNTAQIGEVSGGLTKNSKRDQLPDKIPYLRVANVYANKLDLKEVSEIGITESEVQRVLLKKGDLLIVEGNGSIDQIGRVAVWNDAIRPCAHQNHLIKVRSSAGIDEKYALYFLLSGEGRENIKRVASSTSGLHTLSLSKVENLPIPLCSSEEQHQIVQEIESRLSVAEHLEKTVADSLRQAEVLRQSILQRAFTGQLVPQNLRDEPVAELLTRIQAEESGDKKKAVEAKTSVKQTDEQLSITF